MKASAPQSCPPPVRKVSVIVPCRNEAPHLSRFLESVLRQDLAGIDLEIIIADGMSDDGTRGLLKHYGVGSPGTELEFAL